LSKIDILGVRIDDVAMNEAIARVEVMLADDKKHQIVTPNPEFAMLAQKDEAFRQILNEADLAIPDGIGILAAAKYLAMGATSVPILRELQKIAQGFWVGFSLLFKGIGGARERVTGTDLMLKLCERAAQKGWRVFLLGGDVDVAQAAAKCLLAQFPSLRIAGTSSADPSSDFRLPTSDFLFVAYGAPKQEKWIAKNLTKIPVKVAMGVGGAFDFITGKQKRAPTFVQKLGLEWLWRLSRQPRRLPRIFTAFPKFPLAVAWRRLRMV